MAESTGPFLYQGPVNQQLTLREEYVGQNIKQIQAPAAIVDLAVVKRNCKLMLETAAQLKVQFRAHVKTHKTIEGAKLQVGEDGPIRLIVSTIAELEHLVPWLQSEIEAGKREVNVLYGIPAAPSSLIRLAKIANTLGRGHISLLADHPETIDHIKDIEDFWDGPIPIFIKIDTGYHRAGVQPRSAILHDICLKVHNRQFDHEKRSSVIVGLYSHLGHSYGFSNPDESIEGLLTEFESLLSVAKDKDNVLPPNLQLSVGATPTATAAQIIAQSSINVPTPESMRDRWQAIKDSGYILELHAGVYPFLDLQQMATHARISNLKYDDIGMSILAEVASLYPDRSPPEALIAAGSMALGREPCKSYSGWGVVSSWTSLTSAADNASPYTEESKTGWIVGRISQEHGILSWQGDVSNLREIQLGEKLLIWPNHACIAGAGFGWYLVVDSSSENPNVVRDVWVRCRGW